MEANPTPVFPRRIPVIGVVGGIGSGKSAVANWVADHSRVVVIDADRLGHEALKAGHVRDALRLRFGSSIFDDQGVIIRSELAKQVFGNDAAHLLARGDLERIVHPEIGRQIAESIALAAGSGSEAVLLDAAVLLEAGWRNLCDLIVYIETPDSVRLQRVREKRGWTEEELRRREASQWSLPDKRREADLIVVNDQNLDAAGKRLLEALKQRGFVKAT